MFKEEEMNSRLRVLGLVLAAVCAMAAVPASPAQAEEIKITTGASPAWLTATQVGGAVATVENGGPVVSCEEASAAATVKNGDTSITVVPTAYRGCHVTIGIEVFKATVTSNDCDVVLHGGVEVSPTTFKEGEGDLKCPAGKVVEIHIYKNEAETEELCTFTVAEQLNKKGGEFHNVAGSPNDVTVEGQVTGNITRDGSLLCGKASNTALIGGIGTAKAYEDLGGTISNGTVSGLVEGSQVSLTASK